MVIDDEETIMPLFNDSLNRLGCQIAACNDCKKALKTIHRRPESFDLVLMDLKPPGFQGWEIARAIRGIRNDIPVILLSVCTQDIVAEQSAIIKAVIYKPRCFQCITGTLKDLLKRAQNEE